MTVTITHHYANGRIDTHEYAADMNSWVTWCESWTRNGWDTESDRYAFSAAKNHEYVIATIV